MSNASRVLSEVRDEHDLQKYRPALRRYFARRAAAAEVEDLVQEVFVGIQGRAAGTAITDIGRYLFVVAGNVLSRRRRRAEAPPAAVQTLLEAEREDLSPERILVSKERLSAAVAALKGLSPRTRQVFLLHRFEGLSYRQIAERLGVSVSAIEKHMMTAIRALAHAVEERP